MGLPRRKDHPSGRIGIAEKMHLRPDRAQGSVKRAVRPSATGQRHGVKSSQNLAALRVDLHEFDPIRVDRHNLFGSSDADTLRIQPRTTTYAGGSGPFEVTQLLYLEQSGVNAVAGAYVFKTGDFNRDNAVDQADVALFKNALTLRGVTLSSLNAADHPKFRFDLNGNDEVSWKDVKILQQFYPFLDGDANIDQVVSIADFSVLAANFNQSGPVAAVPRLSSRTTTSLPSSLSKSRTCGTFSLVTFEGMSSTKRARTGEKVTICVRNWHASGSPDSHSGTL